MESKQVFEVDGNGKIVEVYMMTDEEIEESSKTLVIKDWQGERLFEPKWNFETEEWEEGLSTEEIQRREQEIEEQEQVSVATKEDIADLKKTLDEIKSIILKR